MNVACRAPSEPRLKTGIKLKIKLPSLGGRPKTSSASPTDLAGAGVRVETPAERRGQWRFQRVKAFVQVQVDGCVAARIACGEGCLSITGDLAATKRLAKCERAQLGEN